MGRICKLNLTLRHRRGGMLLYKFSDYFMWKSNSSEEVDRGNKHRYCREETMLWKNIFSEKKRTKKGIKNKYRASINERRETSFYVARLFRDLELTTYLSYAGFPQLRHSFEQARHDFSPFGQRHLRPDNYNDVRNLLCKRFLKNARRQPPALDISKWLLWPFAISI